MEKSIINDVKIEAGKEEIFVNVSVHLERIKQA
jgi:hypothetical protein